MYIDNNDPNEANIYRISAPSNEEVDLSMIIYNGDPKVYISYYYEIDFN